MNARGARAARIVTRTLEPVTWTVAVAAVIGWHAAGPAGLGWGLLGAGFAAVLPEAFVRWGLRRGHWADRHLPVRHQRLIVLGFVIASISTGLAVLAGLGAPRQVTAAIVVMLITATAVTAITATWKISIHCAAAGGATFLLLTLSGAVMLPVYGLVALTGWSRVALRAHTRAQVAAGTALGTICALLYLALR